jgi:hypothetical protein
MRSRNIICGSTASDGDKLDRGLEKIMYSAGVILVIAITLGGWMRTTAKDFAARGWVIFLRVSFFHSPWNEANAAALIFPGKRPGIWHPERTNVISPPGLVSTLIFQVPGTLFHHPYLNPCP